MSGRCIFFGVGSLHSLEWEGVKTLKGMREYWQGDERIHGSALTQWLEISRPAISKTINLGERIVKGKNIKLLS